MNKEVVSEYPLKTKIDVMQNHNGELRYVPKFYVFDDTWSVFDYEWNRLFSRDGTWPNSELCFTSMINKVLFGKKERLIEESFHAFKTREDAEQFINKVNELVAEYELVKL